MTDTVTYPFTRGDDFSLPMTLTDPQTLDGNGDPVPVDITGWVIESQVRYARKLIVDLTVTMDPDPTTGLFTLSATQAQTALWPTRQLKCDVQMDRPAPDGRISSQTFIIDCLEDQTQ